MTVHNLIQMIIQKLNISNKNSLETLKLQKILYYCNGWNYALNNRTLIFEDELQAWAHGPVVPNVYNLHAGEASISTWPHGGDSTLITPEQERVVDAVLHFYGAKSGWALRNLTHTETPWKNHWEEPVDGIFRNNVIPWNEVGEYFQSKSD